MKEDMREAEETRETLETKVKVKLKIDGSGRCEASTGFAFFDHMLRSISKHSLFDVEVEASGDLKHHLIEDVALTLGQTMKKALGDKKGIRRFGFAYAPMDDALARAVVDLGGRSYTAISLNIRGKRIEDTPIEDLVHFVDSLAQAAQMNIHLHVLDGENDHHKIEAAFKALALALREAVTIDPRMKGVPSAKGVI
jgi:imidazoleglycerol-phosphate dehydratase